MQTMPRWDTLLDESALASVFPGDYARFVLPIREGLIVFLEGLPEAHQGEIIRRQAALPLSTDISQRLGVLAQCCPVLHKLGQTLARDQRLAPELRQCLRELESLPPSAPQESIAQGLAHELGPLKNLDVRLAPAAIAEASVAVVIPFVSTGESNGQPAKGVFKLLKSGIEERLHLELELLGKVGEHLDQRCEELRIPSLDYRDAFEQIRDKLEHEVRLDREQTNLAKAADYFADDRHVHVPALFDLCTPRVTAMERLFGVKVTDHRLEHEHQRQTLAERLTRALISRPMFQAGASALFHGDPHAGNILLTDDDRLGILDWSLVGTLSRADQVAIVQIILGAVSFDAARIISVLESLSRVPPDPPLLAAVVQNWLAQVRAGKLSGLSWLVGLLDDAVEHARLRASADLMLFRKSLHTLQGVVADIGAARFNIDEVVLWDFLAHFTAESPWRLTAQADSREFATRLSNIDLLQAFLSSPLALSRFWSARTLDLWTGGAQAVN